MEKSIGIGNRCYIFFLSKRPNENKFIGILKNWKFTSRETGKWETWDGPGISDSSFTTMMTFLMQ
jgi:hypothetical protein